MRITLVVLCQVSSTVTACCSLLAVCVVVAFIAVAVAVAAAVASACFGQQYVQEFLPLPPPFFVIAAAGCCLGCMCVVDVSFLVVLVVDVVVVVPQS
jgi:hypothetical protein